jgi:hypothetical protein
VLYFRASQSLVGEPMNADNSMPGTVAVEKVRSLNGALVAVAFVALITLPWTLPFASLIVQAMLLGGFLPGELNLALTIGIKLAVGTLAALDRRRSSSRPMVWAAVVFVAAFLPLAVWVATYFAARELVRRRRLFHLVWISAVILGLPALAALVLSALRGAR